jgi:hypothetical protein
MDTIVTIKEFIDFAKWNPDNYINNNPELKILVSNPYTVYQPAKNNLQFFLDFNYEGIFVIILKCGRRYELIYEVYIFHNGKTDFLHTAVIMPGEDYINFDRLMFKSRYESCRRNLQCKNCKFRGNSGHLICAVNPLFVMDNFVCKDYELR